MSARSGLLCLLVVVVAPIAPAQCSSKIDRIEDAMQSLSAPAGAKLRTGELVRYRRQLLDGDYLDLISVHDGSPFGGYSERGLFVERGGQVIREFRLADVPELKPAPKYPNDDPSDSFRALAFVQGCTPDGPIEFVSFQWEGDLTSPALLIALALNDSGYEFAPLPTISGGRFDISRSDARIIREWDNLHEGSCEACLTRYEIRTYQVDRERAVLLKKSKSKRRYTSGNFGEQTRVRFVTLGQEQ